MYSRYVYGIEAEQIALNHLKFLGYVMLFQRYKTSHGEIDLIVLKDEQLLFVEVKARKKQISLHNIISNKQLLRNYAAAEIFLSKFIEYAHYSCRFDLIIVIKNEISAHIKNLIYDC